MTHEQAKSLGTLIAHRRNVLGLSYGQLASAAGLSKSQVFKLETDFVDKVQPRMLQQLAAPLEIPLADLYSAAGFTLPTELPSFAPYLRSKYRTLPEGARQELAASFERVAAKYGYDPAGPAPGEDENRHQLTKPPKGGTT